MSERNISHWLAKIPSSWQYVPLKRLADVVTGSADTVDADPDGQFDFVVRSSTLKKARKYTFDCEAVITAGDGAVGEVFHHLDGKFLAHQRTYVIHNFRGIEARFFFYYFSAFFRYMCQDGSAKTTVDSVRRWMLTDMPIAVPPREVQRHIVQFLDAELGRIDTLQTGLQRLADLVEERRLARLTSSFSSFDAEKLKLKWILKKRSEEATPGSGTVTAFRDGQVTLRKLRREDGYTFSETEDGYQSVHEGDLVFHGLDGFAGAIGIAEKDGNCSPVYHVCSLRNPDYDLTFIAEYLRYLGLAGYLATEAPNVRQRSVDFRNWDRFANLLLPFPRLEEQRRIIASLSADLEQDESFVQQVTQMQDLLKERRTALITAAVTGELEV